MLNLGRCVDHCESDEVVASLNSAESVKLVKSGSPLCANGYLVTRRGAEMLIKNTWPFFAVWDMMPILMNNLAKENQFNLLSTTPRLFDQDRVGITNSLHKDDNPECNKKDSEHYMKYYTLLAKKGKMAWEGEKFTYERETMTCRY
mmetsp:Transcript_24377/g.45604  ORF Transcript_24377/g.45604 Transcript_24377/m.45604 type:complete len:146 (+) Transcript_24377:623-1060(+)